MEVRNIKTKDGQSLIEWQDEKGDVHRAWVPHKDVVKGEIEKPEQGVAFGDPFAKALTNLPKAHDIEQRLHNNGLWTWEDIKVNPNLVASAVAQAYEQVFAHLLTGEN